MAMIRKAVTDGPMKTRAIFQVAKKTTVMRPTATKPTIQESNVANEPGPATYRPVAISAPKSMENRESSWVLGGRFFMSWVRRKTVIKVVAARQTFHVPRGEPIENLNAIQKWMNGMKDRTRSTTLVELEAASRVSKYDPCKPRMLGLPNESWGNSSVTVVPEPNTEVMVTRPPILSTGSCTE